MRLRSPAPNKVLFPDRGETKLDLVRYYPTVEEAGGPFLHPEHVPEVRPAPA
jgi:DNA primase